MKFKAISNNHRELNLNTDLINIYVSRWKPETWFNVEITRKQAKKSDPMRRFYFAAVLPPFLKELGYEQDEGLFFHQQLKIRFFEKQPEFLDKNGDSIIKQDKFGLWENVPSVFGNDSDMDVSVKKEFTDWVVRKAAHYGVYIEEPGE